MLIGQISTNHKNAGEATHYSYDLFNPFTVRTAIWRFGLIFIGRLF